MKWDSLPEGWKVKALTRVAQLNPTDKLPNSWSDQTEVAYIPMENVEEGTGHIKEISIRPLKNVLSGKTRFRYRDTLFAKITPCLEHKKIAFVESIPTEVGFGSTEFYVLRPNESAVVPKYLFYVLQSDNVVTHAVSSMTGTSGRKRVPSHAMRSVAIPLPPLEEQRLIAEILERANELRHKRKVASKLIDKIIRALFLDMFGDPATNPKGWEIKRLGDIAEVKAGSPAPQKRKYFEDGKCPFVRVQDLGVYGRTRNLNQTRDKINDLAVQELKPVLATRGSVLLPKSGMSTLLNHRAILTVDAYVVGHLAIIVPRQEMVLPDFLFELLCTVDASSIAQRTTLPSVSLASLRKITLPCPSVSVQQRFARLVSYFEEKRRQMQQGAEDIEKLYQSLLNKAFSGQLTKQWREVHQIRWELPQLTERQKVLLAALYYYNAVKKAPPPITMLMKYMFLLQQEKGLELEYAFVPYKFGPFSKEVYEDIEALERETLVLSPKKSKNIERQETALDEDASDDIEAVLATIPESKRETVGDLVEKYGSMGFNELMNYVYSKYPEFTVESRRVVKQGRRSQKTSKVDN